MFFMIQALFVGSCLFLHPNILKSESFSFVELEPARSSQKIHFTVFQLNILRSKPRAVGGVAFRVTQQQWWSWFDSVCVCAAGRLSERSDPLQLSLLGLRATENRSRSPEPTPHRYTAHRRDAPRQRSPLTVMHVLCCSSAPGPAGGKRAVHPPRGHVPPAGEGLCSAHLFECGQPGDWVSPQVYAVLSYNSLHSTEPSGPSVDSSHVHLLHLITVAHMVQILLTSVTGETAAAFLVYRCNYK